MATLTQLENEALTFHPWLMPWCKMWRSGELSSLEMAGIYILALAELRRPTDWLVEWRPKIMTEKGLPLKSLNLSFKSKKALQLPTTLSVQDFILNARIRSVPEKAHLALQYWHQHPNSLVLMETIPTPLELLSFQSQGKRCVTMITKQSELKRPILSERDAWSFLLHDLVHAHQFFSAGTVSYQIASYRYLYQAYQQGVFAPLLRDKTHREELDYALSDMNTHVLHLWSYLKGLFERAIDVDERESFNRRLFSAMEMSPIVIDAYQRLNSPHFTSQDEQVFYQWHSLKMHTN